MRKPIESFGRADRHYGERPDVNQYADLGPESEAARELWKLEATWVLALQNHDQDALARLLADTFTCTAPFSQSEPINKSEYIAEAIQTRVAGCEVSNFSIRQSGNLAVVKEELMFASPPVANSSRNLTITDMWINDGTQWKAVARLVSKDTIQ